MGLGRDKCTNQMEAVVNKYNNTAHSTIKMSPNDARKEGNELATSFNIWAQSEKDRVYPELKVGDEVRGMLTKDSKTKGYTVCLKGQQIHSKYYTSKIMIIW